MKVDREEQPATTSNRIKFRKIWTNLPSGFWENSGIFPGREEESRAQTWLSSRLCKHGMALITDAYFGVTSVAAGLLFVSMLCFRGWSPASPRESTCKEYYSVLKHLSSEGAAFSPLSQWLQVVIAVQGIQILFWFFFSFYPYGACYPCDRLAACPGYNSPLWKIKGMLHKSWIFFFFQFY